MKRLATLAFSIAVAFASVASAQEPAAASDAAMRVFVIRHANAWKNVPSAERPRKMSDAELDSLTPQGLVKADQVGASLAGKGIVAIYCSPAQRARQTAEAIAKQLGLDAPIADEAFRTLDKGSDKTAASGTVRMRSWQAGKDPRPPGGESLGDGFARASAKLDELRARYGGKVIAVVTHGEISATLLAKAAGADIVRGYFDHFPGEGRVREIEVSRDGSLRTVK